MLTPSPAHAIMRIMYASSPGSLARAGPANAPANAKASVATATKGKCRVSRGIAGILRLLG
jgi:hypothetical protein